MSAWGVVCIVQVLYGFVSMLEINQSNSNLCFQANLVDAGPSASLRRSSFVICGAAAAARSLDQRTKAPPCLQAQNGCTHKHRMLQARWLASRQISFHSLFSTRRALPHSSVSRKYSAQERLFAASISLSVSSNLMETVLFSHCDQPNGQVIALILNYHLPVQVNKLLQKGIVNVISRH